MLAVGRRPVVPDLSDATAFARVSKDRKTAFMDTSPPATSGSEASIEQFAASLAAERIRVCEFVAAHRARLERAETALEDQIQQLAEAAESPATAAPAARREQEDGACRDWETEKLRLLAALESDPDKDGEPQRAERSKIDEVVQTTEKIIAEKNREIQQLLNQLEESAGATPPVADKTAAVAQTLDSSSIIQEEREQLRQLQEQWRNKLCHAEIELSLERASLARQRSELDEQMQAVQANAAKTSPAPDEDDRGARPARGRWLSRLGLTDADRERGRKR
jgi:hypothetical protein